MRKLRTRGFTLIELLVVISIISMLSSVILVSLQGARDKGRVGGGVQFAAHNFQGLGVNALLYWKFDNDTSSVADSSGNNVTGTFVGTPTFSAQTPTGSGKAIVLGPSSMVTATLSPQASFTSHTVSVWINPSSAALSSQGTYGATTFTGYTSSGSKVIAMNVTSSGIYLGWNGCYASYMSYAFQSSKWQQVTYTYNASTHAINLYVDGRQVGQTTDSALCGANTIAGPLDHVALGLLSPNYYEGMIDDVAVYGQTLTAADVRNVYAQGLATHSIAVR